MNVLCEYCCQQDVVIKRDRLYVSSDFEHCKVDVAKSLLKSLWLLSNSWRAECKRIPSIPATVAITLEEQE